MTLIDVERRKQDMNMKVEGDPALSQLVVVHGIAHEKRSVHRYLQSPKDHVGTTA